MDELDEVDLAMQALDRVMGGGKPRRPVTDASLLYADGKTYGARVPGNIDLSLRPWVMNPDGSISTVRSMGVWDDELGEILIPTVSDDGRLLTGDEAWEQYLRTGKHMGAYDSIEDSNRAAQAIHEDQERYFPDDALNPRFSKYYR